jgi:hypothetical protein
MRNNHQYQTNEEFTPYLKSLWGATKNFFGNIGRKFTELTTSFSEDFKEIKNQEELKQKTIQLFKDLSKETIKKINSIKSVSELKPIIDEFEFSLEKILKDFEKMNESRMINENLILGAKAIINVFTGYWNKFKKDYNEKLEILKKERDKVKALNDAKKATIAFIEKTVDSSIEKIKTTQLPSSKKSVDSTETKEQDDVQTEVQTKTQVGSEKESELTDITMIDKKVKSKFRELLKDWKTEQKKAGKNAYPGKDIRKRLMEEAKKLVVESKIIKSFESFVYRYY